MSLEQPTIFVVDDDEAVRDSIEALVLAAGYRVRSFASGEDFLAQDPGMSLAGLLLDVRMPGINGLDLFESLMSRHCGIPVVFISGHADVAMAVNAMRRGAFDFIEKPFSPANLLEKIQAALRAWTAGAALAERCREIRMRVARLTARERQVLERVVAGDPNKAIAARLGISQKTIETHRFRIMKKMEAKNLPDLVQMVVLVREGGAMPERTGGESTLSA